MTYDEWREGYFSGPLTNEAMARAAWNAATSIEREACAQICDGYAEANHANYSDSCAEDIRARGNA